MRRKILLLALGLAAAVALVPTLIPAGPDASLDAAGFLESGRFLVAAGVIFVGGLLTSLTPCVYPLIPITVSVFGARNAESRLKAVALTSAYVGGMGVVFSVLGVAAALTGKAFGTALGNPWVVSGLALFLLVLASSMFGAFELAVPSGLAARLNRVGGSGLLGALLMGSVAGVIAAPCTGPVLASVLAYVAKSQSAALGGGLLFVYALGIGVPFFLLGAFTVRLPKAGVWMEWVKSVFGIALVALAFSYSRDAFPAARSAAGAAADEVGRLAGVSLATALTFGGIAIGAIHRSFKEGGREILLKGAGVAVVVLALLLRSGASGAPAYGGLAVRMGWAADVDRGVRWHLHFPSALASETAHFDDALSRAKGERRPVMIDFFADWCEACKELDRHVYTEDAVAAEAGRFLNIKVDATNVDEPIEALFERFEVQGLPTVAFIDSNGELLEDPRVTGFLPAEKFLGQLRKVR
ncbi:MAG: thioredoxin family protein [Myxococcales bacterium]|nr:thioredoxin family protein [Myxococcales bacterium]